MDRTRLVDMITFEQDTYNLANVIIRFSDDNSYREYSRPVVKAMKLYHSLIDIKEKYRSPTVAPFLRNVVFYIPRFYIPRLFKNM